MKEDIKITVLVDNKSCRGFANEHGFSMLIEADNKKIIFDTGQNEVLQQNSKNMGVDLSKVDTLVLSHGHYDHTGGIPTILNNATAAHVYINPEALLPRYSIRNEVPKIIQMPLKSREKIINLPDAQIHWVLEPTKISENIGLTGPIPRKNTFEDTGGPFFLDPQGNNPDPITDDQALWIKTPKGLVVCVGCSHSGIINTLNYVTQITGETKINTLIGGFHLVNANQKRIDQTVAKLEAFNIEHLIPCHCTGEEALEQITNKLEGITPGHAGLIHTIG